jgi:predicted O-methyltransferase YrrM
MASLSESSLRPTPMVEPEPTNPLARSIGLPSPAPRASRAKQLFVSCARTLHDLPVAFPALVKAFRGLQKMGINVTPNHYYWPVPDLAELEKREWPIYSAPPGCHFDLKKQAELARELSANYGAECCFSAEPHDSSYHYNNGYFEAVDAEVAYFMVRQFKPARIVEIGTGYSTRVLATALERNSETDGLEGQLISIDPNPERFLKNGWRSVVVQIPRAIQEVELKFFGTLQSGDILFIDSSHVVSVGSDVLREYLQILPQLKPGVLVHIHDIFLPSDYPRDAVLKNLWFWSEQYLLQAFLSFNSEFEVLWGSSAMQIHYPWVLEQCFPSWKHSYRNMPSRRRRFVPTVDQDRVWPSSFWMRRH